MMTEVKEKQKKPLNNSLIIKRIAFDAIFSAITIVLYIYAKFPISIFPSFLEINFSMIPVIICAFMLGPWDASIVVLLRCLLKWAFVGSGTGYVGELADVLIGLAACIPAGCIYHYTNLKHKTLFSFMMVCAGWILMGILSNIFINIPWYTNLYFKENYYETGVAQPLVGMCSDAFKLITFGNFTSLNKDNFMFYYIVLAVIPFNLLLSLIVVLVTFPVHKRLRVLYDMINLNRKNNTNNDEYIEENNEIDSDDSNNEAL